MRYSVSPRWAVVAAALIALAILAPQALMLERFVAGTAQTLGFVSNYDGVLHGVSPNSPAARAGLAAGDRIDLRATPYAMRRFAVNTVDVMLASGTPVTLGVRHAGVVRTVVLVSAAQPRPPALELFGRIAVFVADAFGVCIALAIIGRRGGVLAWLLFVYALSLPAASDQSAFGALPVNLYLLLTIVVSDIVGAAGPAALLLFALRFPDDRLPPFGHWAQRAALVLGLSASALWIFPDIATTVFARPANAAQIAFPIVAGVTVIGAAVTLWFRLRIVSGDERQRMSWLIMAIILSPFVRRGVYLLAAVAPETVQSQRGWITLAWLVAELLSWSAMAYAVLRYRVVSLAFVADRALVLGVLATVLGSAFGSIEWVFAKLLDRSELVPYLNLALTLCFALGIRFFEQRAEALVDLVFFARRHRAERRLARSAAMLGFARTADTIHTLLLTDPVEALKLTSAAVFRRTPQGSYRRFGALGWNAQTADTLHANDPLILALQAGGAPAALADLHVAAATLPQGAQRPALAVPILVPGGMLGVLLYGGYENGSSLDPDAVGALKALGAAAGPAFTRLELQRARRRAKQLSTELTESRATIEELRNEVRWLRAHVPAASPAGARADE